MTRAIFSLILFPVAAINVHAQQFSVLSQFGNVPNGGPSAPAFPGVIAQGRDGNLYSTTPSGGAQQGNISGTIFQVTPAGKLNILHSFDLVVRGNPYSPQSGLTLGTDGFFYGTTAAENGFLGSIFKADPGGNVTVLHTFPNVRGEFAAPYAPPIQGTDGNFYGTTSSADGVYKIAPDGTYTALRSIELMGEGQGGIPHLQAPLIQASDGAFYGTTPPLGPTPTDFGTVFRITSTGELTYIYKFDNKNGAAPKGPVIEGSDGDFYGTTSAGGASGLGVVFKLSASGDLTVLHNFSGVDGKTPIAGLVQANNGAFYGVASAGGTLGFGTIFKITSTGDFSVIHNFDDTNGATPGVTLVQHTNGLFYSDTTTGGSRKAGVFYSFNDGLQPFVSTLPTSGQVGAIIGVLGQGFTGTTAVAFNGNSATFTVVSDTFLTVTVPSHGTSGKVTVTNASRQFTSNKVFTVVPNLATFVSAASSQIQAAAAGSIVTAFGSDLASGTAGATALPLPNTLVGTSVNVIDSKGVNTQAPLFYVSPGQVNFLVPPEVANGDALFTVTSGSGTRSQGKVTIGPVAPGIFVLNPAGLVAANVVTLNADGSQVSGNSFQLVNGQIVPLPINLGPPAKQVSLVLYGTGISGRSSLANVSVSIGGMSLPVVYAGAQGSAGLDQVNVLLPASLAGSGDAVISLVVDGMVSNTAHITIK